MAHSLQNVDVEYDLFVSYAQADRAWVEGYLLDALTAAKVHFTSELNFQLGAPRLTEFERAVRRSHRTLLVISSAYAAESILAFVELLAQHYGIESGTWPVIPLLLEPVQLPPRLAILVHLDATDSTTWPDVVTRLCTNLKVSPPGPSPRPPCPYPGMRAFQRNEATHFFGRDDEIEALIQKLRSHPLVAVIGPSGSGKSSLVLAGLLPALEASTFFGPGAWAIHTLRPGGTPLQALAEHFGSPPASPFLPDTLLAGTPDATRLLLVVDQLEEIFTQGSAESEPFFAALQTLATTPNCYLVFTIRSDFFDELVRSTFWPAVRDHQLVIAPLDAKGLHTAIVRPAEALHVYIESALVERLVAGSVGEPGVLPFVQEVMVRLWERLERRYLPLRAYETLVLPLARYSGEERSGIQAAMAQLADEIINKLSPDAQLIARRILLRLVQFGEGRADTRRQQRVSQLRNDDDDPILFIETLAYLVDNRLLVLSGSEDGEDLVDLAHEAMLTGWPRLEEWITTHKADEEMRRRLAARVQEWVLLGRGVAGLLDSASLAMFTAWYATVDTHLFGQTADEAAFLASSRKYDRRRHRERRYSRILMVAVGIVLTMASAAVGNWFYLQWVNRGWVSVPNAPTVMLSAITTNGSRVAVGSYDFGVAEMGTDGAWSPWLADGLPEANQSESSDDPAGHYDPVIALAYDLQQANQLYAVVEDEGLFRFDRGKTRWKQVGPDLPPRTEATMPLAASAGVVLYLGNEPGLFLSPNAGREWLPVANQPPLDQTFEAVLFDSDGVPYLAGERGIYRGIGDFPFTWERVGRVEKVQLLAVGETGELYAIVEGTTRPELRCLNAKGVPLGEPWTVPVTNWLMQPVSKVQVDDLVAHPKESGVLFLVDSHGALYMFNCTSFRQYIGQANLVRAIVNRIAIPHEGSSADELLWANGLGVHSRRLARP